MDTVVKPTLYGIYNTCKKEFQFGIKETSKRKAIQLLFVKIGKDAYKWRFEARKLPKEVANGNPN